MWGCDPNTIRLNELSNTVKCIGAENRRVGSTGRRRNRCLLFNEYEPSVAMKAASWLCDIHLWLKFLHGNEGAAKRSELKKYPFPQGDYGTPLKCVCVFLCINMDVCGAPRLMLSAFFSHSPLNFLRQVSAGSSLAQLGWLVIEFQGLSWLRSPSVGIQMCILYWGCEHRCLSLWDKCFADWAISSALPGSFWRWETCYYLIVAIVS